MNATGRYCSSIGTKCYGHAAIVRTPHGHSKQASYGYSSQVTCSGDREVAETACGTGQPHGNSQIAISFALPLTLLLVHATLSNIGSKE